MILRRLSAPMSVLIAPGPSCAFWWGTTALARAGCGQALALRASQSTLSHALWLMGPSLLAVAVGLVIPFLRYSPYQAGTASSVAVNP